MSKSCHGSLEDLVKCLRASDCMQVGCMQQCLASSMSSGPWLIHRAALQKEGKTVTDCALTVEECQKYRAAHARCKRSQIDARSRIQGNKSY